ncbi:uncharacterized protein LOC127101338 [Lathyrus oleraceus]|uniref:uncharacterized protein LOC127101338 n=1 Tax=Pisum sativum TaxID=3888 RepID=UPI0021D0B796|nr:uncharacterized protein LOC127101338 [Pisum sativum]
MTSDRIGIHSYKLLESRLTVLKGLEAHLILENKEEFKKTYRNILGILNTEVNTTVLALTLEEYSHILGVGIKNRVPFVCTKELPKSHIVAEALHLEKKEVELNLKLKGGIHGFTSKFMVDKATTFSNAGSWMDFNVVLTLLIYGIVLFLKIEDFMDLAAIHIFLMKNHIPTNVTDTYYSNHVRTQKKKGTIICCIPLLYIWFISHLPSKGPFIENKGNLKWSQRIMSLNAEDISWYSRSYDNVKLIHNNGDFLNVPLLCTKGGINYNPRLALC